MSIKIVWHLNLTAISSIVCDILALIIHELLWVPHLLSARYMWALSLVSCASLELAISSFLTLCCVVMFVPQILG